MTDFNRFDFAGTLRRAVRSSIRAKSVRYVYKTAMGYSMGIKDMTGNCYDQWIVNGKMIIYKGNEAYELVSNG